MADRVGVLDSYHLNEALEGSTALLGARCGQRAVELLSQRLQESIGSPTHDQDSYVWRSAIEKHEQDEHKHNFSGVLIDTLRDALLGFSRENPNGARESIRALLQSPYPTIVRIAIYVCGERYSDLGDVFWEIPHAQFFGESIYWHELFWFIKKAFSKFSLGARTEFIKVVNEVKGDWRDIERANEFDDSLRRDILFPASGQGDKDIDELFSKSVQRSGPVREHPDFDIYSSAGVDVDASPVVPEDLVKMPVDELVKLMRSFAPTNSLWQGPSYRGLADSISTAVRASENGFSDKFNLFKEVNRAYQHGLIRGLQKRWTEDKRDIAWSSALRLILDILASDSFVLDVVAEQSAGWGPSVHWVISDIADLIKSGISNSSRAMPEDCMATAIDVLDNVLALTPSEQTTHTKDAVSHAINTSRGRILETLITASVSMHRAAIARDATSPSVWHRVQPIFERELQSSEQGRNAEFATMGGMYCSSLHFLSSAWVEENFERLFPIGEEKAWKSAAQGFAYHRFLHEWLFRRLRQGGHLQKMLVEDDLPNNVSEKAVQFLGLAYLEGMEELTPQGSGLLDQIVSELREKELSGLCWFFWTLRGAESLTEAKRLRILTFLTMATAEAKKVFNPPARIYSALNLLAEFFTELDDLLEETWRQIAPFADSGHHGYILVEHLARLAAKYPKAVANVFLKALEGFVPDYDPKDVVSCVEQLAQAGHRDEAELICVTYTQKGSNLLKDTYKKIRNINQK